ncbi:MAG: hypothetical protein IJB61_04030 [Bacteroides sp]|nr:hypothetical protein [Bacteroides sp.]
MKTKVLLTTAALSVAFAACTNEEIIEQSATVSTDRIEVGALEINPQINPESRLHLEGSGFVFDKNDKLGACLMDEITESYNVIPTPAWRTRFDLVDYIQTNYKFVWNGSKFQSDALLVEGNYFFYFPYDASMVKRNAFQKELASEQTFTVGSPRQTVLDNQVFIGHKAVTADKQGDIESLDIEMKAAHAYPAFRLNYSDTKEIQIKKVALKVAKHGEDGTEGAAGAFNTMLVVDPTSCYFNNYETIIRGSYYSTTDAATAEQISLSIPNVKMTANSQLAGYIVVPAGVYAGEGTGTGVDYSAMWMYIYTNKGLVKTYLDKKNPEQEPAGTPSDNVWTKGNYTDFKPNNGMLMEVGFSYDAISTPTDFVVSTTEDFELFMEWQKDQTVATTLNAKIVGTDVVLSKNVMNVLNNKNLTLNIKADAAATLTIPAGVPANTFDRINLTSDNIKVVNYADLTIAENYANGTSAYVPSTFVNNGNVTFKYEANTLGVIDNYGTIAFNKTKANNLVYSQINSNAAITNRYGATINVEKNTTINGTIANYGKVNVSAGMTLNAKINNETLTYGQVAVINVNGTWNAEGTNKGEINVYGAMVAGANGYENTAARVYNSNWSAYNEAVINNEGSIKMIKNNGNVVMVESSASYDTYAVTGATGYIDNSICSTGIVASETETIYVKVTENKTASDVNSLVEDAAAEQVRFIGAQTLTVDTKTKADGTTVVSNIITVNEVIIAGNLNIVGGTSPLQFNSSAININSGTTTLAAKTHVTVVDGLDMTLAAGTKLDIRTSAQLQSLGEFNIYGEGTVLNQGTYKHPAVDETFVETTIKQEGKGIKSASSYVWDGSTKTSVSPVAGVYAIETASELAWLADQNLSSATIKLAANLDMAGGEFKAIVSNGSVTIDGQGHTIQNVKFATPTNSNGGSCGPCLVHASSGTVVVKDLNVVNASLNDNGIGMGRVAVICGYVDDDADIEITNVHVSNSTIVGLGEVGGLIGKVTAGSSPILTNCSVTSTTITATEVGPEIYCGLAAGGLVGSVATNTTLSINKCESTGNAITAASGVKGNIIGSYYKANGGTILVDNVDKTPTAIEEGTYYCKGF